MIYRSACFGTRRVKSGAAAEEEVTDGLFSFVGSSPTGRGGNRGFIDTEADAAFRHRRS